MALTPIILLAIIGFLLIGSLYRPILGVLGYIVIYLIYNPVIWWGAYLENYLRRPSFVAVIFITLGVLIHRKELNWSFSKKEIEFYSFLLLAWLVTYFFGVGVGWINFRYLEKLTKMFIFIFLFIRVNNSLENYKLVLWVFILGAIFLSYEAHLVSDSFFHDGRLDGFGGPDFRDANGFAAFLTIVLVLIGTMMLKVPLKKTILFIVAIALIIDTIILTRSRAIFLGIAFAVPYALFRPPPESRKKIYLCVACATIMFFILMDTRFLARMDTIKQILGQSQFNVVQEEKLNRIDFWKASLKIFLDYPLGIGVKNFEKIVPLYDSRNPGKDAHNTYVLCYSELGIFGIGLFLMIIFETIREFRRIPKIIENTPLQDEIILYNYALKIIFIIFFLGFMVTHSILYMEMLWILISLPICLENAAKKIVEKL